MIVNLAAPVLDRAGKQMRGGTLEAPGPEATIGSVIFQIIDTPIIADANVGLPNRVAVARLGRKLGDGSGEVELNSTEISLILERAAALTMASIILEQVIEALDPVRLKA